MTKKLPKQNVQQAFNQFLFDTMMERIRGAELLGQKVEELRTFRTCQQTTNAEIFDKLRAVHTCHNVAAMEEDRKRIIELEIRLQDLETSNSGLWEHGTEQDAGILKMQKRIDEWELDRKALFPHTHTPLEDKVLALEKKCAHEPLDRAVLMQHSNRLQILEEANAAYWEKIQGFEAKMKEQRGDYHDHIAQLVGENNAAHELIRKNASVAQECGNAQAHEILKMQEQIKGLENRLSRAQDFMSEGKKTCKNCVYGDGAYCNHETPSHCSHYELWVSKTPLPLKGKPAAKKTAGKVQ